MKISLSISSNYGFDHNWTLTITKKDGTSKAFYLGQDGKFCSRVLGMEPAYIVEQIGSNDLTKQTTREKLARFILKSLNITPTQLFKQETWALCAE